MLDDLVSPLAFFLSLRLDFSMSFVLKAERREVFFWHYFFDTIFLFLDVTKIGQWILHKCGNTTEATALLQQFIKKKIIWNMRSDQLNRIVKKPTTHKPYNTHPTQSPFDNNLQITAARFL